MRLFIVSVSAFSAGPPFALVGHEDPFTASWAERITSKEYAVFDNVMLFHVLLTITVQCRSLSLPKLSEFSEVVFIRHFPFNVAFLVLNRQLNHMLIIFLRPTSTS